MNYMKITQINNRYVVESSLTGRMHILNKKSFDWNMKHVVGVKAQALKGIHMVLEQVGHTQLDLDFVRAA